jgi:hypothetical protein
MRTPFAIALLTLLLATSAPALDVTATWSPPRLYEYPPPSDLTYEGSVQVTFTGDEPMTPVDPTGLIPINDSTWRGFRLWDDFSPFEVIFTPDGGGEPDTVVAIRQPARPLDLDRHDGLVITIDTAHENLWSPDIGLYVWGLHENCLQRGDEWERPAQIAARNAQGNLLWSEPVGLRINGQSTRYHVRKGLRSYFDDHGFVDWIETDLFGDGVDRFGRLVYKATFLTGGLVSSSLFAPLHQDLGNLGSRHRLAGLYLQNEYWGAYSLRERLDHDFVEITHELAESGEYTLIKDDEAEEGDAQLWYDFLEAHAVPPQDYGSHDWFTAVAAELDLHAYMDWMYLNILGASADNGWVNNIALLKVDGGKWRYLMWDAEGCMAELNLESNHFRFYASADAVEYEQFRPPVWSMGDWWPPHQPWRDLFRGLMQNSEFKAMFSARIDELAAGPLSVPSLHARLDSLQAAHQQEMSNHQERWDQSPGLYLDEMQRARDWLAARVPIVAQQKVDFFDYFAVPVELSAFDVSATLAGAVLTWRTERERDNAGFQIWRSLEGPDSLTLLADWRDHPELVGAPDSDLPRDYSFTDPDYPAGQPAWYQLRHEATDGTMTVHQWIERAGPPQPSPVRLNELMADNDHVITDEAGEFDDWFELYNPGPDPVSLAGLGLADDLAATDPWPLPDVTLGAGEYLIVWADEDPEQGPLHADFKLSAGGESLVLFQLDDELLWTVDSVTFGAQATDVSFGRLPDGDGAWQVLESASPGQSNEGATAATPSGRRGLVVLGARPNPLSHTTTLRFSTGPAVTEPVRVGVYDLRGRLVREIVNAELPAGEHAVAWDRRDGRGRRAPAGVYLMRVTAGGVGQTTKLSVVK